jgi:xanthine/uracil permease
MRLNTKLMAFAAIVMGAALGYLAARVVNSVDSVEVVSKTD